MAQTYGFLIERFMPHGGGEEHLRAYIVLREEGKDYPKNTSSDGESEIWGSPKEFHGLALAGLELEGFVHERDGHIIGFDQPEYRNIHSVDLPLAEKQVKTLKKISRQIERDKAYDRVDAFVSMAKALKLSFTTIIARKPMGTSTITYSEHDWVFMSIEEGRNYLRKLMNQMAEEQRAKVAA